eukprot:g5087.t1
MMSSVRTVESQQRQEFFRLGNRVKVCEHCWAAGVGFTSFGFGKMICIECAGKNRGDCATNRIINLRGYKEESVRTEWIEDFFRNRALWQNKEHHQEQTTPTRQHRRVRAGSIVSEQPDLTEQHNQTKQTPTKPASKNDISDLPASKNDISDLAGTDSWFEALLAE